MCWVIEGVYMVAKYGVFYYTTDATEQELADAVKDQVLDLFKQSWQNHKEHKTDVRLFSSLKEAVRSTGSDSGFMVFKAELGDAETLNDAAKLEKLRIYNADHQRIMTLDDINQPLRDFSLPVAPETVFPTPADLQKDSEDVPQPAVATDSSPKTPAEKPEEPQADTKAPSQSQKDAQPQAKKDNPWTLRNQLMFGGAITVFAASFLALTPLGGAIVGTSLMAKFAFASLALMSVGALFKLATSMNQAATANQQQQPSQDGQRGISIPYLGELTKKFGMGNDAGENKAVQSALDTARKTMTPAKDCQTGCCGGGNKSPVPTSSATNDEEHVERKGMKVGGQ